MSVFYRDKQGLEYESVPLPTHEVTDAVPLNARVVSKRSQRKTIPLYEGTDGAELIRQPRGHRHQWTDGQWVAFEEYRQRALEEARTDSPIAATIVIK